MVVVEACGSGGCMCMCVGPHVSNWCRYCNLHCGGSGGGGGGGWGRWCVPVGIAK